MIELTLTRGHIAPSVMLPEALEEASCRPTYLFEPHSVPDGLPEMDVAQRLIDLAMNGDADELTWANY